MQNAITTDFGHLKGLETPVILDWMALSELKLPSLGDLTRMSHDHYNDEQAEYLKKELHTQVLCFGTFTGTSDRIKVEIILLNTGTKQILLKLQVEAPLQYLTAETSKTVLKIAESLGTSVKDDEKG